MLLKDNNLEKLLAKFNFSHFDPSEKKDLDALNQASIREIADKGGVLSDLPPFERHPYLRSCSPGPDTKGLMIGTFPPINHLCFSLGVDKLLHRNKRKSKPDLQYCHGNRGALWEHCPIDVNLVYEQERQLQPAKMEALLGGYHIEYTDMIAYCQRSLNKKRDYSAADIQLQNIVINRELYQQILSHPSIEHLYFTNSAAFTTSAIYDQSGQLMLNARDAFMLFVKGADQNGYSLSFREAIEDPWLTLCESLKDTALRRRINKTLTNKVLMDFKLAKNGEEKELRFWFSISPAALRRGRSRGNKCILKYQVQHKVPPKDSAKDFLGFCLAHFFRAEADPVRHYNIGQL